MFFGYSERAIKESAEKIEESINKINDFTQKAVENNEDADGFYSRNIRANFIQLGAYYREGFDRQKIFTFVKTYFGVDDEGAKRALKALA